MEHGAELGELSGAFVHSFKTLFGRGPTRVASHFAGPDTLVVTLEKTLTPGEQRLVWMGEQLRLCEMRKLIQLANHDDYREIVEDITDRKVRAVVSGLDPDNDIAVETFILEPLD